MQSSGGGNRPVEGADVLVAMYSERDSFAVYLLKKQQINRLDLTQYLSHGTRKDRSSGSDGAASESESDDESGSSQRNNPLSAYTVNLNEQPKTVVPIL